MSNLPIDLSGPTTTSVQSGSSDPNGDNNDFVDIPHTMADPTGNKDSKKIVGRKFYEVLAITERERRGRQYYYKVSWKNYLKKTWEPRRILMNDCPAMVKNIDEKIKGGNRRAQFNLGASKSKNKEMNFGIKEVKVNGTYYEALKKALDIFTSNQYFKSDQFQMYVLK